MGLSRLSRVMRMGGMSSMTAEVGVEKKLGGNGDLEAGVYFHGTYDRHDCVLTSFLLII